MAKGKAKMYENGKWNVTNLRFLADFGECIKGSVIEAKSGKRLGFLEVALSRYGITKKHVCEVMKMPESTLMYQFRNDDISISTLYEFAEAFDLKFCINFKKDS